MFQNHLKIAFRSLRRNSFFTTINLLGLAAGLTCCLLMVLYIQHELSYDRFQEKGDRIVRMIMKYNFNGGEANQGNFTSAKVFPTFRRNFPEVESGVRISALSRLVKYEDRLFSEKRFLYVDSTFFQVFSSFVLLKGNPKRVLDQPKVVVLTESSAKKYFGNDDPIGKILLIGSSQEPFQVTGIVQDCPSNSQIKFDFLGSFSSLGPHEDTYWNANFTTYLLLKNEASMPSLQAKTGPFMKTEMRNDPGVMIDFNLEPFFDVHLHSAFDGFEPNSSIQYLYIIGLVAFLILMIACFTYINLSTSRSMERAKEVGIRKVSGAFQGQVFWQFITESFVVSLLALVLSFGFAYFLLPQFSVLADRNLVGAQLFQPEILLASFGLLLVLAFLAGSYPAVLMSRFQPVQVLKGSFKNTSSGANLRKALIVFQFGISVFLLVGTLVVKSQLHFIQNSRLGYDREHVLVMTLDPKLIGKIDLVKSELKQNPEVLAVSLAYESPVQIKGGYGLSKSLDANAQGWTVNANPIDDEYIKATGLQIVAGSDLSFQDLKDAEKEDDKKNYYHFILNETACRMLGWKPEEALGQKVFLGDSRPGEVKAVVRDFHYASLHSKVEPLVLFPGEWRSTLIVKTTGNNLPQTLSFLEEKWKALGSYRPFDAYFMDETFNQLYTSEKRTGQIFSLFSGIAILLACLGLFGLSAYAARQRIKEIGIRKVLGASVAGIALLLSRNFLKLVLIAFIIASPLAWWAMQYWLQDFAYRIEIQWWMFAGAGLILLIITLLTVSIQAIKAAISNPVKSLRTE